MSGPARILVALLIVLGASLFVFALLAGDPPDRNGARPRAEQGGAGANGAAGTPGERMEAAHAARPGVLDDPTSCRECHTEIWNEWTSDRHAKAWVGELYTELSENHKDPNCWSCHAPRPVLETGIESPAEARANFRESGINCLSCHRSGPDHVAASRRRPAAEAEAERGPACGPRFDPRLAREGAQEATVKFCGVCHALHGTDQEFMRSHYYREGQTCLSCHMEEVVGVVANGGEPRTRRSHRMHGGHSPKMLKRAMALDARREGDRIVARVTNEGAGHNVPTDARHRGIWVRASFYDRYGQPVPVVINEETGELGSEKVLDLIRLFYRHEQKPSTQIPPRGTLGKENWRESSTKIPEEAKGGHAIVRLHYSLRWDWPPEKSTLVHKVQVPLD